MGTGPIHKFLTLDQRWEVATACPALWQSAVCHVGLIRVDASAEDIDQVRRARLVHIARLEVCNTD